MIIIEQIFSREEALAIGEALDHAPFQDGSLTAGPAARKVKQNTQARGDDAGVAAMGHRVRQALERHDLVRGLVRPIRWSNLLFSRYGPGQQYGLHADNAVMVDENGWPLRTDVSFTLFLSDPETYGGGALRIPEPTGDRMIRPDAGCAVFYPTGVLHQVTPVTVGVRVACVGWIQSMVKRPDHREILYDLDRLRDGLADDAALTLDKTIGNLLRMWAEV
ncbi:MAG: Fe2+-dependent dioxygenase [Caulobacteraceae bacterium]|nr:Fe2+-dependent dioxygenase [Caulobacteraceae bacterium]